MSVALRLISVVITVALAVGRPLSVVTAAAGRLRRRAAAFW